MYISRFYGGPTQREGCGMPKQIGKSNAKPPANTVSQDDATSRKSLLISFAEYLDEEAARGYDNGVWDEGVVGLVDCYDGYVPKQATAALAGYHTKTLTERKAAIEKSKVAIQGAVSLTRETSQHERTRNPRLHPDLTTWACETGNQQRPKTLGPPSANQSVGNTRKAIENASMPVVQAESETRMRTMPYREYLQTAHWRRIRRDALDRAHDRCQLCNAARNLEVHHRTYERRGSERSDDLIVLCARCHAMFHQKNQSFTRRRKSSSGISARGLLFIAFAVIVVIIVGIIPHIHSSQNITATENAKSRASSNVMSTYDASANATATAFHAPADVTIPGTESPVPASAIPTLLSAAPTAVMVREYTGETFAPGGICPNGFPVKGNEYSGIYHVPGGQYYDATNARHCFATEQDAINAGYRKSKV